VQVFFGRFGRSNEWRVDFAHSVWPMAHVVSNSELHEPIDRWPGLPPHIAHAIPALLRLATAWRWSNVRSSHYWQPKPVRVSVIQLNRDVGFLEARFLYGLLSVAILQNVLIEPLFPQECVMKKRDHVSRRNMIGATAVGLSLASTGAAGGGQAKNAAEPTGDDVSKEKGEVKELYQKRAKAFAKKDLRTLVSMHTDDFNCIPLSGEPHATNDWERDLAFDLEKTGYAHSAFSIDKLTIRGNEAFAYVTRRCGGDNDKGQPFNSEVRYRDVLVRTANGWKIKASEIITRSLILNGNCVSIKELPRAFALMQGPGPGNG
jgi:ketosteroid isomerase-like protein